MYNTKVFETFEEIVAPLELLNEFYDENFYTEVNTIAKGDHLKMAVMDSGVDVYHPMLASRFCKGFDCYSMDDVTTIDKNGHGTFMTGLISARNLGLLKNAELYPVKVCDTEGRITLEMLVNGIQWCIDNDIHVIVLAVTTKNDYPTFKKKIKEAVNKGIVIVCSACNDNKEIGYPAKYEETITVSGITYEGERPDFSINGVEVDMNLPSVDIPSTYYYNRFALSSGNSAATAIGACFVGMMQDLALRQLGCALTTDQMRKVIQRSLIDINGSLVPTFHYLKDLGYDMKNLR